MSQPVSHHPHHSDVVFTLEGAVGVIALDRPAVVNALNLEMVEAILGQLQDWSEDEGVRAVLIEGRGEKGLCAGGDVRAVREAVLSNRLAMAMRFFASEYDMVRLIATYEKPIIALQAGAVMGGGIGVSSHARYRIATPTSRFAMPEAAIGFFCDVGVNALLAQAMRAPALAFLLSGSTVEASDAIALGLCDLTVPDGNIANLRQRLIDAAGSDDLDTAFAAVLQSETTVAGDAPFCRLAHSLADCFEDDSLGAIIDMLDFAAEDGDVGAATLVARLRGNCPTSMAVILAAHLAARRNRRVEAVLETDLKLAKAMVQRADFAEGVRAQLVDKDKTPIWSPNRAHLVDQQQVAGWFA